jgi:hypothetical protein
MDCNLDNGRFSGPWTLFRTVDAFLDGFEDGFYGARCEDGFEGARFEGEFQGARLECGVQGRSNVGSRWRVTQRVESGVDAAEPAPANSNAKLGSAKAKLKLRASLAGALTSDFLSRRTGIAAIVCCPLPPTRSLNCINIENQDVSRLRHNTRSSAP